MAVLSFTYSRTIGIMSAKKCSTGIAKRPVRAIGAVKLWAASQPSINHSNNSEHLAHPTLLSFLLRFQFRDL